MQIIYIHGLHSGANAEKGQLLKNFCNQYFPQINVLCPDLNQSPDKVLPLLIDLVNKNPNTGIVGSSLGGFFSTLVSKETKCKAVLLNPSTNPAKSLKRFAPENFDELSNDSILHTTAGGWQMTKADILWFEKNRLEKVSNPEKFLVILKQGDALLDYRVTENYFSQSQDNKNGQSHIIIEPNGDHPMSDFATKLPQVIQFLFALPTIK